jgi:hypothetical protein
MQASGVKKESYKTELVTSRPLPILSLQRSTATITLDHVLKDRQNTFILLTYSLTSQSQCVAVQSRQPSFAYLLWITD